MCRQRLLKGLLLLALVALTAAGTAVVVISQANRCAIGPACGGAAASLYAVEAMPSVVLGEISVINAGCLSP